jgi:hypothetical protein
MRAKTASATDMQDGASIAASPSPTFSSTESSSSPPLGHASHSVAPGPWTEPVDC